jgi:SAM-dependent methyltransferase
MTDPKAIVEQGYDTVADRYAEWARTIKGSPTVEYLERLLDLLPARADVLELGCGNGEPAARMLAAVHRYTGIDISRGQLRRARQLVPGAELVHADYTDVELPADSYDAVVALYTFGHVPRTELPDVVESIVHWLRPGGYLLATAGIRDSPGEVEDDWLGAPMFFASYDLDANLGLVTGVGLDLLEHRVVEIDEGEHGLVSFLWILARKPPSRGGGFRSGCE